jgi:hypothetical protein
VYRRPRDDDPRPLRGVVRRYTVDHDVVEDRLRLFIGADNDEPGLLGFRLAGHIVNNQVGQAEMPQVGHASGDEDAIWIAAGDIEVCHLPVLLILQPDAGRLSGTNDLWQCARAIRVKTNGMAIAAGSLRREHTCAHRAALEQQRVAGLEREVVCTGQALPR